jgi:hypothetical protein
VRSAAMAPPEIPSSGSCHLIVTGPVVRRRWQQLADRQV